MFPKRHISPFFTFGIGLAVAGFFGLQSAMAQAGPGSSSGAAATCSAQPVQMDLNEGLEVRTAEGQTQVVVDWSDALLKNSNEDHSEQVDIFMDYLERNPRIGESQTPLKSAFATHMYQALSQSQDEVVLEAFNQAISKTIQGSQMLSNRNINTLFVDYYPYIFLYQLKQSDELADAFLRGVQRGLEGEKLNGSQFLEGLGRELKTISGTGKIQDTASCLARVAGGKTLSQLTPGMADSVYDRQDADMQAALNQLKADGKLTAILDSIKNDQALFEASKEASKMGIHSLLRVWSENDNVQNLITLYETDENARHLVDNFYQSSFGREVDECIRNSYRPDLLGVAQEVYLELIQPELSKNQAFDEAKSDVMIEGVASMMMSRDNIVRQAAESATQEFINDYLSLEAAVAGLTEAKTPFTDYYQAKLSNMYTYTEGMKIDIYRDGRVIHTETNPNITQFIDRDVPENFSKKPVTHNYYLNTYTECDSKVGQSQLVLIPPTLNAGQLVQVKADVQIQLKKSQERVFMDRLHLLLGALEKESQTLDGVHIQGQIATLDQCTTSREALLEQKTTDYLMQYVLDCFGDAQLNQSLQNQMENILTPLSRFLELSQFTDIDQITKAFLAPMLEIAKQEYEACKVVVQNVQPLAQYAGKLLQVESFDEFTPEQRELIVCGGHQDCVSEVQTLMQTYLLGPDYNPSVVIEVYNQSGQKVLSKAAKTNIFGELKQFELGTLMAGVNYEVKVRPQDQPYALPKISQVNLITASVNADNQFETTIDLKSDTPFFFGNFDNSDDEITLKDVEIWSQMINENPEAWASYDIDGFVGVDLFDVQNIQQNWGTQAQIGLKALEKVNIQDLVIVFGVQDDLDPNQIKTDESLKSLLNGQDLNYTPYWLYTLK